MTQDDVIRLVREAGWTGIYSQWVSPTEREHLTVPVTMEQIKAFAKLVATEVKEALTEQHMNDIWQAIKIEREACAKVCEDIDQEYDGEDVLATWCAQAIRARGQA